MIKLHTGGGETLVGLLIAQSTLNEKGEPVLYLTPTVQLMNQALAKAKEYGLPAVPYATGREPLPDAFTNGQAVLVATYNALFNGISKFGVSGTNDIPVAVGRSSWTTLTRRFGHPRAVHPHGGREEGSRALWSTCDDVPRSLPAG